MMRRRSFSCAGRILPERGSVPQGQGDERRQPRAAMTQEEAFLQAICESPNDDVPRLVYADWLEENGGPDGADRAEFIRVQVERARLPADDPRQAALRQREERMAEGHAYGWRVQLPRLPGVTWRR